MMFISSSVEGQASFSNERYLFNKGKKNKNENFFFMKT
jgi:hypothetical protein